MSIPPVHPSGPIPPSIPAGKKPSPVSLQAKAEKYWDGLIENGLFSGTITVAVGDKPVFERSHSYAKDQTFDEHTLFNSCSVTKLFTAIAIHQLVEEGMLDLNDTVGDVLDLDKADLNGMQFPLDKIKDITILQLLNHTSGLVDDQEDPKKCTFDSELQDKFNYSNIGYKLLSEIVSQASPHDSFHEHVEEEILKKADMRDALGLQAQFNPETPHFATPDDYESYNHKAKAERAEQRAEIQSQIESLSHSSPTPDSIQLEKNLKKKLTELDRPTHFEPRASGHSAELCFVTPPAGNGCFEVSNADWLKFSQALVQGKLPLAELQSHPVRIPVFPIEKGVNYCAGFEKRPTSDGRGTVLYRHGDSAGASSAFFLIQYPDKDPITIIVNSNFGQSRGNHIGDELCSVIEGQEITPLQEDVALKEYYRAFDKAGQKGCEKVFEEMLARKPPISLHRLPELIMAFIGEEKLEMGFKIADMLFVRGRQMILHTSTREKGKEYIDTMKKLYESMLQEPNLKDVLSPIHRNDLRRKSQACSECLSWSF